MGNVGYIPILILVVIPRDKVILITPSSISNKHIGRLILFHPLRQPIFHAYPRGLRVLVSPLCTSAKCATWVIIGIYIGIPLNTGFYYVFFSCHCFISLPDCHYVRRFLVGITFVFLVAMTIVSETHFNHLRKWLKTK